MAFLKACCSMQGVACCTTSRCLQQHTPRRRLGPPTASQLAHLHALRSMRGSSRAVRGTTGFFERSSATSGGHAVQCNAVLAEDASEETAKVSAAAKGAASRLVDFLNEAWTPFHATQLVKQKLLDAGYVELIERDQWKIVPGGKYFITRNMSSIVAFAVGEKYSPGSGFHVLGAHTDSPCLKLKPISKVERGGCLNVGVQTYGGGLWHTWFDRDLSVAGRILVEREDGVIRHELVKVPEPLLRIPCLAIHLDRGVNTEGFKVNAQTHLAPLLATAKSKTRSNEKGAKEPKNSQNGSHPGHPSSAHHAVLLNTLAEHANCSVEQIRDLELQLCDTQPSAMAGPSSEFLYSGRLDNLCMCFASTEALLSTTSGESSTLAGEASVRMVALFDHEECGSDSAQGASSPMLLDIIRRAAKLLGKSEEGVVQRSLRASYLVSADMAHALHPNYMERHEELHQPAMGKGLVIKHNANQRYATNAVSASLFREIAIRHGLPAQEFVVRSDMGCGSTIGPILASGMGINTVDVGAPQLSMHSVREMMACADVEYSVQHFTHFFNEATELDRRLRIDGQ